MRCVCACAECGTASKQVLNVNCKSCDLNACIGTVELQVWRRAQPIHQIDFIVRIHTSLVQAISAHSACQRQTRVATGT